VRLVVDASTALSWFFEDERDDASVAALRHIEANGAAVPPLWSIEIAHVLVKNERRGCITAEQTATILEYLRALPFLVETGSDAPAFPQVTYARRFSLSAYDAAYLDLAVRFGLRLATRDERLAGAARALDVLWVP
jgi:predicted nucleic acid-binding protein